MKRKGNKIILVETRKAFLLEYGLGAACAVLPFLIKSAHIAFPNIGLFFIGMGALVGIGTPELIRLNQRCIIDDESLIVRRGIIGKKEINFHLTTVTDVFYKQNGWQRLLGYGHLIFRSFSPAGKEIKIGNIHAPHEVSTEIMKILGKKLSRSDDAQKKKAA